MDAIDKTKSLKRVDLNVSQLLPNTENPNKMSDREFNLLSDNIEKTGLTDPLLVRPVGDKFRIVGGHHRLEAAKLLGFETVPCTIIEDPEFDAEAEAFQIVRMNTIRGHLDPAAFMKMYETLAPKYSEQILQEAFGFASDSEFQKLIKQMTASVPEDMKKEFKKAAKEIKTIDGLSKLLNRMFTEHGSTLEYGYMVVDYGGKDSVWVRISPKTYKDLLKVGGHCREKGRTIDALLGGLLHLVAEGALNGYVSEILTKAPSVVIPEGDELPTEDSLEPV